jgi:hypothetical protein
METKHIIALVVFTAAGCASILTQLLWSRARDIAFFLIVAIAVLNERFDVNFFGEYWYRGTARGVGLSLLDTLAWGVLAASVLVPRYERRKWFAPPGTFLILLYFSYCVVSVVNAFQPRFASWELTQIPRALLFLIMGAMYVRTEREVKVLTLGICGAIAIEVLFGVKQHLLMGIYRVPGTLSHPNSLSMFLCTVAPVALAGAFCHWEKWLRWVCGLSWAASGVLVVMSLSRAGLPIFFLVTVGVAVMCSRWNITRQKIAIVFGATAILGGVVLKAWPHIKQRYDEASLTEEYTAINGENRGVYWRWAFAMVEDYPYGVGLNNWSYMVSKKYGYQLGYGYLDYDEIKVTPEKADLPSMTYAPPAHSLAALTIGELGWMGFGLFSLIWMRWFYLGVLFLRRRLNPEPMHRIGIGLLFGTVGIFLQSITEWTYRQTTLLLTFHVMMGALASLHYARKHARVREPQEELELEEIEIEPAPLPAAAMQQRR